MTHTHDNRLATLGLRRRLTALSLLFSAALCVALVVLPSGARAANNWHVSPNSAGACTVADPNCATIQAAVTAASSGDTIQVAAGTYKENVVIGKDLTINGAGAAQTVVDGTQTNRVFTINIGTVSLSGMTITNGKTTIGGGVITGGGTLTVTNVIISNNSALGNGGGVFNLGTLNVINSTVSNNSTGGNSNGGGICNLATLNVTNSTVSNNSASIGGGGIYSDSGAQAGTLTVTSSTVSNNSAGGSGGGININNGTANVRGSIVAGNTASSSAPDVKGQFTTQGHNLVGISDGTNGFTNGTNGDIVGTTSAPVDAKLSPLGFYGGPTQTQLLLCDSPAIDAGDDSVLNPPLSLTTDQRGAARKAGTHVDIGAVETQKAQVNSNNSGAGSLRQLILDAQDGAIIDLDCSASAVTLTSGELLINKNLTINGPGPSLLTVRRSAAQGTPEFRIFEVAAGKTVSLSQMTISNGRSSLSGGGIYNNNGARLNVTNTAVTNNSVSDSTSDQTISGGGIENLGTLSIMNSTVSNNSASSSGSGGSGTGGGISNKGTLTVTGSTVGNNFASHISGGIDNVGGTVNVTSSTISGNTAANLAGGIFNQGIFTLTGSTVSGNSVTGIFSRGGGILNNPAATLTITSSTVSNNSASQGGGVVNNSVGTVNVRNSIIAGNTASNSDPDLGGQFASQGHNLVGKSDGFTGLTNGTNGDIVGTSSAPVDAKLLPLGDYGGPTLTQLPGPSSPAVDAGDDAVLNPPFVLLTDQRGSARKVGAHVDIGAVEFDPNADTIDAAAFFVRQHYHDFLNRAPDPSGFQFWTSNITSCGADANCVAVKRVDTSAAFFLSIEFQQTGDLVYKMYKASFGNLPGKPVAVQRANFLADTQTIQSSPAQVIVGQGNWQAQLESNKTAFAQSFVQRPTFQSAHGSQDATTLVNSLFTNAGVTPTTQEQQAAINAFNGAGGGVAGQAAALRSVAESNSVTNATFDESFVLMQYFGYLQRDPDSSPDTDFSGYNFWLSKLNQFGGNYVKAEMVKAFITSTEYRQRFGD